MRLGKSNGSSVCHMLSLFTDLREWSLWPLALHKAHLLHTASGCLASIFTADLLCGTCSPGTDYCHSVTSVLFSIRFLTAGIMSSLVFKGIAKPDVKWSQTDRQTDSQKEENKCQLTTRPKKNFYKWKVNKAIRKKIFNCLKFVFPLSH